MTPAPHESWRSLYACASREAIIVVTLIVSISDDCEVAT
jgi:hypothetical protein